MYGQLSFIQYMYPVQFNGLFGTPSRSESIVQISPSPTNEVLHYRKKKVIMEHSQSIKLSFQLADIPTFNNMHVYNSL